MENKRLLVLLSSYNGENFIKDQIMSIMNQKTQHVINLLIRDDGSTDNTMKIILELSDKFLGRIEYIKGNNIGYNKSFFELIKVASNHDYYAISDQDDIWMDTKIEDAIYDLEKEENDKPLLYACPSYYVYDDMTPQGTTQLKKREITLYNTIIQNICPGHEQVMNNLLLNELKKEFDYSKLYVYDAWIANVAILKGKLIFSNTPHVLYRQHKSNAVGYGEGKLGWIKERLNRVIYNDDARRYKDQILLFYQVYRAFFSAEEEREISKFIDCRFEMKERVKFTLSTKLYRQSKLQTFLFKLIYVLGMYTENDAKS